ncbi:hypothetical protein JCM10908_003054 [Rhodotorula pacifica]|uniref:uncharacterized protein n=1 Tax=Rhodotorula pacifica TaxID=1495444 RepID=UPI00316E660A
MRILDFALAGLAAVSLALSAALPPASDQIAFSSPSYFANDSYTKVPLTLGVMSRCPDAILVETLFDRVLERKTSLSLLGDGAMRREDDAPGTVAGLVDLRLEYIANKNTSALYDVTCKHGDIECRGNIQQLCAADLWRAHSSRTAEAMEEQKAGEVEVSLKGNQAWEDWWNFVQCLNYGEVSRIGTDDAASACAKVVGHSWDARERHCVDGKRGKKLLRKSVKRTRKLEVQKSATVLLNDKVICIHDGSWQSCPGGHEISDFVRQIENEWKRLNPEKKKHLAEP